MKKSQSSFEFLILASFMFFFFVGLLAVIGTRMIDMQQAKTDKEAADIVDVVKTEVQLAETSMEGYSRIFYLPESINGKNYTLGLIADRTIILFYNNKRYDFSLPSEVIQSDIKTSTVYKGKNVIIKEGNGIFIDSDDPCKTLTPGANSYCIGSSCYCYSGFYDSGCLVEDDQIVANCGGVPKTDPITGEPVIDPVTEKPVFLEKVDCVKDDPCNTAPILLEATIDSTGETSAIVSVKANERFYAYLNYTKLDNPDDTCPESDEDFISSNLAGPFEANIAGKFTVSGLIPHSTYCGYAMVKDVKGKEAATAITLRFTMQDDTNPPVIESLSFDPALSYFGTEFTLTAKIFEPSEVNIAKAAIKRADDTLVAEYNLKDDKTGGDAEAGDNIYTLQFTVQPGAENEFIDSQAPFDADSDTIFYSKLDDPGSFDADDSEGSKTATASGVQSVRGRFKNGVKIEPGDRLSYSTSGNFNRNKGTIEFWVKSDWDAATSGMNYLFDEGTENSRLSIARLSGNLILSIKGAEPQPANVQLPLNSFTWTPGKWYFIAATWDLQNHQMNLFINGSNEGLIPFNPANPPQPLLDSSEYFAIGYSLYLAPYEANAVIDNLVISKEAKTKEQIIRDMISNRIYTIDITLKDASANGNEETYTKRAEFEVSYQEHHD